MGFDVENFKFSPDILKLSGGNFKAFLKERYGDLTVKQRKEIFDKFYNDGNAGTVREKAGGTGEQG